MWSEFFRTYAAGVLSPTFILGVAFIVGIVFLWKGKLKISKYLLTLSVFLFIVLSTAPIRYGLFQIFESKYQKLETGDFDYVVVLGGKVFPREDHPTSSQITSHLLARVVEGVRLTHRNPKTKLIVTGHGAMSVPEAVLMQELAISLGIDESRIIAEKESMNTADHPRFLKSILTGKKFAVVTSAYHMDRALSLFAEQGLIGTPAPTDFINKADFLAPRSLLPRGENFTLIDIWFQEFYSRVWNTIRPR
jgi:uncharacterized SAM-binding protein YcdF (DUF218 family)